MNRRGFLAGNAALSALAMVPGTQAGAAGREEGRGLRIPAGTRAEDMALSQVRSEFIFFDDPVEEFRQHLRLERDFVEDEGSTLTWYHWIAYVIPAGRTPFPLMAYEGIEYSYYRRVAEMEYRIHAHNLSYVRDIHTGAFLDTIENPLTGKTVKAMPTVLLHDPGTLASPKGFRNLSGTGQYSQPYRRFRIEDNLLKLDSVRTAPPDWPSTHMENSCQWTDLRYFENSKITSLPVHFAGSYVFPYLPWLEMGDLPGNMLGFFDGRKLNNAAEIPRDFLERTERLYPELLQPRWEEFERPIPFPL